jgi:hypothetical protein
MLFDLFSDMLQSGHQFGHQLSISSTVAAMKEQLRLPDQIRTLVEETSCKIEKVNQIQG